MLINLYAHTARHIPRVCLRHALRLASAYPLAVLLLVLALLLASALFLAASAPTLAGHEVAL